jgi:hypothetical protein
MQLPHGQAVHIRVDSQSVDFSSLPSCILSRRYGNLKPDVRALLMFKSNARRFQLPMKTADADFREEDRDLCHRYPCRGDGRDKRGSRLPSTGRCVVGFEEKRGVLDSR